MPSHTVWGGVLETIVAEHAREAFVEFPAVGPKRLLRVLAAFQELSLSNITTH